MSNDRTETPRNKFKRVREDVRQRKLQLEEMKLPINPARELGDWMDYGEQEGQHFFIAQGVSLAQRLKDFEVKVDPDAVFGRERREHSVRGAQNANGPRTEEKKQRVAQWEALAEEYNRERKTKLTASSIAALIVKNHPEACKKVKPDKHGKSYSEGYIRKHIRKKLDNR